MQKGKYISYRLPEAATQEFNISRGGRWEVRMGKGVFYITFLYDATYKFIG